MARSVSNSRKWVFTLLAWTAALLIFFPILWLLLTSFKTEQQAFTVVPNFFFSLVSTCDSSAFFSSALEGMQPTLRHTPPQYFSSMMATDWPSCAARTAAT